MRKFGVILLCVFFAAASASAQVPDSKGRDFWFTFLPNFHNNIDDLPADPALQLEHQIYIYVGSETPTNGTITLRDASGVERVVPFQITDPSKLYEFATFFLPYELRGFNYHGTIDFAGMQCEEPVMQSVHVVADDDVTVYALNQGDLTSDAFLVLPTDAIGTDYAVMSYKSDISLDGPFGNPSGSSTPSQFAVVATEDNTLVEILPTAPTFKAPNAERNSVILDRGQSYLVQVDPRFQTAADLTGTIVRASRPVAVFGGHQRATIPVELKGTIGSRDCIVEQMNPITTWGKSAFVTPPAVSSNEFNEGTNLFRVVSAFDSTDVFIDGVLMTTLRASTYYEAQLTQAMEVRTSKPAGVGVYKKTAGPANQGLVRIGDPFLMLIPPAEQFMDAYRFINIQAYYWELIGGRPVPLRPVYLEQYLNIVIPTTAVNSVILDGVPVAAAAFRRIGTSQYSWAQLSMTDGVHSITSDTTFGIYVYGYGNANSYGYIGGMAFRPLDVYPPRIEGKTVCGTFTGAVTDSLLGDSRVYAVAVMEGSEINTTYTQGAFIPPQAVVPFSIALVDPLLDGSLMIEAYDNVRQRTEATIRVPGFTVGPIGERSNPIPIARDRIIPIRQQRCDSIVIENYGNHVQSITSLRTASGRPVTSPAVPFDLNPGEQITVVLCTYYDIQGRYNDTLVIGNACLERNILEIRYDVRTDEESPSVTGNSDPCSTSVEVAVADDRAFDFGLVSVRVIDSVVQNCTVTEISSSVPRNTYTISIIDPFDDAIYGFEAVDSAGNITRQIDTVPGFTLAIAGERGTLSSTSADPTPVGTVHCDTIWLSNYGSRPQVVRDIFVRNNLRFSLPASQFTITIPPGEQRPLIYCFEPIQADEIPDLDTLEFIYGCNVKRHALSGTGEAVIYSGLSRCDVPVDLNVIRTSTPLIHFPQPADHDLTLVLPEPTDRATVRLVTLGGETVLERSWKGASTTSLLLDLADISAGTYGIVVESASGTATSVVIVR